MASTYTSNTGIEKIGAGEQSGTWGNTTNNNLEIIDRALNGVVSLTITGNKLVTTSDGSLSDGQYKILLLTGSSKWAISLDTGDNELLFKYNGTTVFKLGSNGAVTSANNITAFGTSL